VNIYRFTGIIAIAVIRLLLFYQCYRGYLILRCYYLDTFVLSLLTNSELMIRHKKCQDCI